METEHYVRYGRHDGIGGPTECSFDTEDDAEHFADVLREDEDLWIEVQHLDPIAQFAAQVERAAAEGWSRL